jgi:hypothetical protein
MKKISFLFLICYAAFSITSCKKKDNNVTPVAPKHQCSIMFVNGCAGITQINGYYHDTLVAGAAAINLFSNCDYKLFTLDSPSLVQTIAIKNTSGNALLKDTLFQCQDNQHYSAFIGGTGTSPTITFIQDNFSSMGSGDAKIRFVNLTTDVTNVTFIVGTSTLFTGVAPSQITAFTDIPAGTTSFTAHDPADVTTTERIFGLRDITAGKYYTVYYTGTKTGVANYNLQLTQITNQ